MKATKCNHKSFWDIYKEINFYRVLSANKGRAFKCNKCGKKCSIKWKGYKKIQKKPAQRFGTYLLWMLPAFIVIALVASEVFYPIPAIIMMILYHFLAMSFIINSNRLKITEK